MAEMRLIEFLGHLQKEVTAVALLKGLRRINAVAGKEILWEGRVSSEMAHSGVGMSHIANEILATSKAEGVALDDQVLGVVSREERYFMELRVFIW